MNRLQGVDACLEISLKEYGLAWIKGETETLFFYGVKLSYDNEYNEPLYDRFDWCSFPNDTNPLNEWDWVNFDEVGECCGMDFLEQPFEHVVRDLVHYYGFESMFGSSYWGGFTYGEVRFKANNIKVK